MTRLAKQALGADSPEFSPVAAGLWRLKSWEFDDATLAAWVEHAIGLGITTFDHADIYGQFSCEALFGRWLKAHPARRSEIQLVSKCGIKPASAERGWQVTHYDASSAHILASVDASLRNLGTDYLDLLLLHRPDPLLQPDEVASAFEQLRQSGKVRHFGVSNCSVSQYTLLASRTTLVTNQIEASLLHTDPLFDGSFDYCLQHDIRPMLWSPLAGGQLLDAHSNPRLAEALQRHAAELGVSISTLALAWLLRHPVRALPVIGSRRQSALDEAAAACRLTLDRQAWYALLEAARGYSVP